jgi:O-antigen biosynthesis protein
VTTPGSPKNSLERVVEACGRVGIRGVVRDLKWRFRSASGGRGVFGAMRAAILLAVREGPLSLVRRVRWGAGRFTTPEPVETEPVLTPPPHPWLTTQAHQAAHTQLFDLDALILAENRALVDRFSDRSDQVRTATWFLTYFDHALFGGIHTILRLMDYMTRHHGVEHRLVVFDRIEATDSEIRSAVSEAFPSLHAVDIVLPTAGGIPYDELPYTDVAVCTMWISAFPLARFNNTGAKFYMVQDFEPAFYPAGTLSALAEATYRLGFGGIVNTPGLERVYREYGAPSVGFVPAVDVPSLRGKPSMQDGAPVQVVLYGRPGTPRNAFELIAAACRILKERYGETVRIVSAGEEWDPEALGLEGIIENLGLLRTLSEVQDLYANSDIGVCFMLSKHPSYQPFEYLAARVAPVVNVNVATGWMLEHEVNCLITEPYPSEIAAAVGRLVEDAELRSRIVETGHQWVTSRTWDDEFDRVWSFVTGVG